MKAIQSAQPVDVDAPRPTRSRAPNVTYSPGRDRPPAKPQQKPEKPSSKAAKPGRKPKATKQLPKRVVRPPNRFGEFD